MEGCLLLIWIWSPFALESRSNAVQIKVVAAVVQSGRFAVHITPIGTRLSLLVECRSVRAQESEVLYTHAGHFDAHVEHLALSLCICIVSAEDLVATCEPSGGHIVQTVRGEVEGCSAHDHQG